MRMLPRLSDSRQRLVPVVCAFLFLVASVAAIAQPMSGVYTINPTGSGTTNFTSFGAAVTALTTNGVSGPVTFNVSAATYNEQVTIPPITGASATNTITFDGGAGNAATRIVTYTIPASTTHGYTLKLSGADYIRLKNLTVEALSTGSAGTAYGYAIHLAGSATDSCNFNSIENCIVKAPVGATAAYAVGILGGGTGYATYDAPCHNTLIQNCTITGGYYGVRFNGRTTPSYHRGQGNQIIGNTISTYYAAIYMYYQASFTIQLNDIDQMATAYTTPYGAYFSSCDGASVVTRNKVRSNYGGMYFTTYSNSAGTQRMLVANNMISAQSSSTVYGLYLSSAYNVDVFYNSVNGYPSATGGGYGCYMTGGNHDVRNNCFVVNGPTSSTTLYAFYTSIAATGFINLNYNNYYYNNIGSGQSLAYQSTDYADLATWKTAQPTLNVNSKSVNPNYPAVTNLRSTSAGLQGAQPLAAVTNDIDNNTRSVTNPMIGCFEFSFPAKDVSASALLSPIGKCGRGAAETVIIRVTNTGTQALNCATDPITVNVAITGAATINLSGTKNSGTIAVGGYADITMSSTANMTAAGNYVFNATAVMASDGFAGNNAMSPVTIQNSGVPTIATFPYSQNFEATDGGFLGNPVAGTVNSWAWGTPAFVSATTTYSMNTASSGTKAWQTGYLNQVYPNGENSALESPCFNMSALTNPVFTFMLNFGGENNYEASIVEGSTDGGQTWTKLTPLYPAYGSTSTSGPIPPDKWSNGSPPMMLNSYEASGWQRCLFQLGPTFAGKPSTMFRVRFGSDGSGNSTAGAAVDDVIVGDLLEKDLQVQAVYVRNATGKWARTVGGAHSVQAVVKSNGYENNPTSVTVVYKEGSAPTSSTDGVSETFTPTWNGTATLLTFTAPWTPTTTGNKTIYARVFYTGDGQTGNDQSSIVTTVMSTSTMGFENFNAMVVPTFDLTDPIPNEGFITANSNGGTAVATIAALGVSGSNAATYAGDISQADDWIFTPAAALLQGTSYRVRLKYASQTGLPQTIQLYYGTAANPGAMQPMTNGTLTNFTNTAFVEWGGTGSAPYFNTDATAPGNYFVGIKIASPANNGRVLIDDVVLELNPTPPPKIGIRYELASTFADDVASAKIDVSVMYKTPGVLTRRYQVTNTTGQYGIRGDFLWDAVAGAAPWLKLTKETANPTLQPTNPFTPPRPRQDQYFTLTFDPEGLNPGTYTTTITVNAVLFNDDNPPTGTGLVASNQPFTVQVTFRIDPVNGGSTGMANGVAVTTSAVTAPGSVLMYDTNNRLIARLTATSGTIPAGFTVFEYPNQLPNGYTRLKYVRKYWKLEGPGSGWTANIDFYYTDTEANGGGVTNRSNLRGRRQPYNGTYLWTYAGSPANATGSVSDPATNSVKVLGLSPANISGNFALATNWDNSAKTIADVTEPMGFDLGQNYPNPFNPSTTITFSIPEDGMTSLVVYNSLGREVARLVDQVLTAGSHSVTFDASNLPSGSYVYRLTAGGQVSVRHMTLAK